MDSIEDALALTRQNNEWSAQQAQKQMDFQERMSNTAHQREIEDLKAAGLNPVLSAKLGGSSTPNGAMADTDTSGTSAIISSMLSTMHGGGSAVKAAEDAADHGLNAFKLFRIGYKFFKGSKAQQSSAVDEFFKEVEKAYYKRQEERKKHGETETKRIPVTGVPEPNSAYAAESQDAAVTGLGNAFDSIISRDPAVYDTPSEELSPSDKWKKWQTALAAIAALGFMFSSGPVGAAGAAPTLAAMFPGMSSYDDYLKNPLYSTPYSQVGKGKIREVRNQRRSDSPFAVWQGEDGYGNWYSRGKGR